MQQTEQLCSAVRHLEEDNKELRQELRRVREELARREQHGHTLERLLEETRTQLHTIQHQQCVSTQPHSTPTTTTQHQRRVGTQTPSTSPNSTQHSQSSFTPATRQSPQAHQNLKRRESSSSQINPRTTTSIQVSSTSTGREQKSKDNIIILCDSNGHHLDPRRLFPGRSVKKFWCPTSHSALRLLREGALGAPSHIIIHTGTNDLSTRRVDITKALSNVVRTASRIYPRAKVIISSLLPRRDVPQRIINAINVEIANICAPIPNVHIANHQQVTHQHLYDHIHITERAWDCLQKASRHRPWTALRKPIRTGRRETATPL